MYYVPGFSNYLNGLVPREELLSEDMPAYDAPVYYTPPTPQPVYSEPYYEEPAYYAEPSYSLPTAQPVAAEPYYEAPSYSLPTAQPVYSEPFLGGLSAPTLSEQPVSEAQPYSYTPAETAPIDLGGWDPSMIVTTPFSVLADPGPAYDPNMVYRFDTGSKIGTPKEGGGWDYQNAAPVVFQQGQQYVMVNPLNGNVIGRASTPEEMQKLVDLSSSNKDWQLYRANEQGGYTPGTQLFDRSNAGSLGSMLVNMGALALPAVGGAVLGPVLSGALGSSAAVGTGLGTAIGSAASGVTAGKSLEDILKQAAIAGITAGGLQALAGGPTAAAGDKVGGLAADLQPQVLDGAMTVAEASKVLANAGASSAQIAKFAADVTGGLANTVPTVIGNVVNTAANIAPVAAGAIGGFGGALSGVTDVPPPAATVTAQKAVEPPSVAPVTAPVTGALDLAPPAATVTAQKPVEQPAAAPTVAAPVTGALDLAAPATTVTAQKPVEQPAAAPAVSAPVTGALDLAAPAATVVGQKTVEPQDTGPPTPSAAFNAAFPEPAATVIGEKVTPVEDKSTVPTKLAFDAAFSDIPPPDTTPAPKEKTTLEKVQDIADYMQLAGLGIGALGSLFGGSGQQSAATIANASGLGGLNPTFSAKLPGANIPGLGAGSVGGGPRTAADLGQQGMTSPQDYYRYGYGPEQSFFGYVPQGAPNTSQAYTGYAKGGFAVEGPGDGREDKIPAMLSDGEYVIDAETVALLGNGSNKAGADMLDKFRVKVRKHKGRELARGKFSKNAKRPEQYLAGGRA